MWPFKNNLQKQPTKREPAPCGDDTNHYYWYDDGWPCPHCLNKTRAAIKDADRRRERNEMADLIARKVVMKLKGDDL